MGKERRISGNKCVYEPHVQHLPNFTTFIPTQTGHTLVQGSFHNWFRPNLHFVQSNMHCLCLPSLITQVHSAYHVLAFYITKLVTLFSYLKCALPSLCYLVQTLHFLTPSLTLTSLLQPGALVTSNRLTEPLQFHKIFHDQNLFFHIPHS